MFQLERNETDPDVLRDLAGRSLEAGKEIEELLALLAEMIDE